MAVFTQYLYEHFIDEPHAKFLLFYGTSQSLLRCLLFPGIGTGVLCHKVEVRAALRSSHNIGFGLRL